MNILQTLQQLRDDLKLWVTNNLNALNAKIDEKTIPIDNELDSSSTNPVQNKVIADAIKNIPRFSGDYNDLTNAPNISEDDSGNMVIADESGNVIFKADADGIHTTALSLNGESAATETYVNEAVANIDIPEVDFTGYATEEFVSQSIETTKNELNESITSESEEWKIVDNDGNIIFSVDASGAHTTFMSLNGESVATETYVEAAIGNIDFPETDLTGYATETYVDNKVTDLVNSAPEVLDTLGELATALENHEDAYDALLETVGGKATKAELEDMKNELSESIVSEQQEFHVVDGSGNIVTSIDNNGVSTTTVTAQSIIINGDNVEEHIDNANIHVTSVEKETWNNKSNFSGDYNDLINKPTLFSGSYNDLTDKPDATDLSNYYTKTEVDEAIENVEVDLTGYATEEYVTNAITNIDIPETDLSDYYTKDETNTAIESTKDELSESIVSESEEWHIVDNNGNIVASIDASGVTTTAVATQTLTINGVDFAELIDTKVKSYVDEAILGGAW